MNPVKILSVDDEMDLDLLLKQYFRRKIRKGEYEFFFAHNGLEALTVLLREKDINIILSDINMPEMDGLTLLTKINEMHNPAMKCIMVSAYGDMGNIRSAMNNGAFDFATKPIDLDDLSVTIEKAIEQIEYIKKAQAEHSQLESLKTDLAVAREIQQAILPRVFPPFPENSSEIDLAALMTPAKDVGGDFYDFFRIDDDHIALVIGDVCGKGIPAALFMAVSRTFIRSVGMQFEHVGECMTNVNRLLASSSVEYMFVTVFYAIYDMRTGLLTYCNGGHNPPFLLHANGTTEALPVSDNLIVGALKGIKFKENTLQLEHGDTLVMYTDGVTEAMRQTREVFGTKRFCDTLSSLNGKSSQEVVETVKASLSDFVGDSEQSDDITMLVLKRK